MSRRATLRRTALLAALTAFAIPEMHAEPSRQAPHLQQSEPQLGLPMESGALGSLSMQWAPTQRWVF